MKCSHPNCTGIHDNNRYRELCPAALDRKRNRDLWWHHTAKGILKRVRTHQAAALAALDDLRGDGEK